MMRILVFSDSHSDVNSCIDVIEKICGVDMVIHCGDYLRDALAIEKAYPNIDIRYVAGNCDLKSDKKEEIIEAEGKKILISHGDLYGVKSGYMRMNYRAQECDVDAVVFGHTHIPYCEKIDDITMLNPGSIRYSQSYGVIEIEDDVLRACVIEEFA